MDTEIKEVIPGGEEKTLKTTVKAVEAKEYAKRDKVNKVDQVNLKKCFSCRGTKHSFERDK